MTENDIHFCQEPEMKSNAKMISISEKDAARGWKVECVCK